MKPEHRRLRLHYAKQGFASSSAAHRPLELASQETEAMNLGVNETAEEKIS
jgi:hypothetical protein